MIHSDDAVAIVAYLQIKKAHLEDKPTEETSISNELRERLMEKPAARIDTMVNNEMVLLVIAPWHLSSTWTHVNEPDIVNGGTDRL